MAIHLKYWLLKYSRQVPVIRAMSLKRTNLVSKEDALDSNSNHTFFWHLQGFEKGNSLLSQLSSDQGLLLLYSFAHFKS